MKTDLGETILWETKRHEEDMDVLSSKLREQQNNLSILVHEKCVVETKLVELDQLVGQLLLVNESLVIRLSGKPVLKNSTSIATKKKKSANQQLPRAAYTSTFSQVASAGAYPKNNVSTGSTVGINEGKSSITAAAEDAETLHNMHKMYVNLARNITEKNIGMFENEGESFNNGRGPGSTNGTGSLMSQRRNENDRHNSDAQTQNKMISSFSHYNDNNYDNTNQNGNGNGNGNRNNKNYDDNENSNNEGRYDFNDSFHGNYSSSIIGVGSTPNRPTGLEGLITTLEEEFTVLNGQYRSLLSTIKAESPSKEIQKEQELVSIIQKLHKKGEQLRSLKSPTK